MGPIDVLIRKRELSWERLEHPSQAFKEGDEVEFVITSIDKEKEGCKVQSGSPERLGGTFLPTR